MIKYLVRVLTEMFFYEISAGQSDRLNQISDCQNTKNGWSMTVTGRLFPGLSGPSVWGGAGGGNLPRAPNLLGPLNI